MKTIHNVRDEIIYFLKSMESTISNGFLEESITVSEDEKNIIFSLSCSNPKYTKAIASFLSIADSYRLRGFFVNFNTDNTFLLVKECGVTEYDIMNYIEHLRRNKI
jgi:hypothetical protein